MKQNLRRRFTELLMEKQLTNIKEAQKRNSEPPDIKKSRKKLVKKKSSLNQEPRRASSMIDEINLRPVKKSDKPSDLNVIQKEKSEGKDPITQP